MEPITTHQSGYDDLIKTMGLTISEKHEFGTWQGELAYLLRDEETGAYGILVQSYGSCSGCDAFEAANGYCWDGEDCSCNFNALTALRDQMYASIVWARSVAEAKLEDRGYSGWFYSDELKPIILGWLDRLP